MRRIPLRQNPYLEVDGDRLSENMSEDEDTKQEDTRRAIGTKPNENDNQGRQVEEETPQKEIKWPPECKTSTEGNRVSNKWFSRTSTSPTWLTTQGR